MKTLVLVFFMIPVISLGQTISIDFENNDLTEWTQNNPGHWCISENRALAGDYSLVHCYNDSVSGADWIALFHSFVDLSAGATEWNFMVRYNHNPSSSNRWALFLTNNSLPDESGRIDDGLVLGVNYEGNSDELMIWQEINGTTDILLSTGFNWEEHIPPEQMVTVKLSHLPNGKYTLEMDTSGNGYINLGSASDHQIPRFNALILYYKYTASYDQGLGFDNLKINGNFIHDDDPLQIQSVGMVNPGRIEIQFSKPVTPNPESEWCILEAGCGTVSGMASDKVEIELPVALIPRNEYTLRIPEITDINGNAIEQNQRLYSFYYPGPSDILINEILADPSPAVMLPEGEYLELFNNTEEKIFLNEWTLSANDRHIKLPSFSLMAGEYALICENELASQFDTVIQVIAVEDFPALNNSGSEIRIQDRSGKLIHAIHYSDDWYDSDEKKEGGWSLEMINPKNSCSGEKNWSESSDYHGGTPGHQNSVLNFKINDSPPELWRTAVTDNGSLILYFSEPLDSISMSQLNYYIIDHGIGYPDSMNIDWPFAGSVELFFKAQFRQDTQYEINLTSDICNCSGTKLSQLSNNLFYWSMPVDSADILINELMFDPEEGLIEYIELYNNSGNSIDLNNFRLIVGEPSDSDKLITSEYWPMLPGTFAIIAKGYDNISEPGDFKKSDRVIYMPDMPSLSNTGNTIYLLDSQRKVLDIAAYEPTRHHDIYTETKGISLERISPGKSGIDYSNWHSASSDAGYRTPAMKNSQMLYEEISTEISIFPEAITPDADGRDDELTITYQLDKPGYMIRIMVFDVEGRQQAVLVNGQLLGTEGTYFFNGKALSGNILPTGLYVLYFEAYNDQGDRHVVKKAFVVAR